MEPLVPSRRDAACVHPLLLRRGDLVPDAFRDDLAFLLRERYQGVQHHASGGRAGVDVLRHGNEVDAASRKIVLTKKRNSLAIVITCAILMLNRTGRTQ